MAEIYKGVISQFDNSRPIVKPFEISNVVTPPLTNKSGETLKIGDKVVYSLFEDGNGIILYKI